MTNLLKRWEVVLAMVLVLEFVLFSSVSPYFLSVDTLSDATFNFTERALVALPLALLIIAGEIDISVAAIVRTPGPVLDESWRASAPPASRLLDLVRGCSPAASTVRS